MNKIIKTVWYGSQEVSVYGYEPVTAIAGAVLIWNGNNFRAFIGVGTKGNEEDDIEQIADWGNSISKKVALAIFGDVEIFSDGSIYKLSENYKY